MLSDDKCLRQCQPVVVARPRAYCLAIWWHWAQQKGQTHSGLHSTNPGPDKAQRQVIGLNHCIDFLMLQSIGRKWDSSSSCENPTLLHSTRDALRAGLYLEDGQWQSEEGYLGPSHLELHSSTRREQFPTSLHPTSLHPTSEIVPFLRCN